MNRKLYVKADGKQTNSERYNRIMNGPVKPRTAATSKFHNSTSVYIKDHSEIQNIRIKEYDPIRIANSNQSSGRKEKQPSKNSYHSSQRSNLSRK